MPLSDNRVISLLNAHFVPVYLANQDYRDGGSASSEEKAELRRIHREAHAARLSVGTVHAFVLSLDGQPVDSLHVAHAFKVPTLVAMLERAVARFDTHAGAPLVKPRPQSVATVPPGALLLHVTARYLERKGNEYALIVDAGGNWSAFPGEDWITLGEDEWRGLLPPAKVPAGESWEVERAVAGTVLTRFYPPTENNDLGKNRVEEQSLKGTLVSETQGVALARLEGRLRLKHPFYHKDDNQVAVASLAGYLEWEPARARIRALRLVTDLAEYGENGRGQPYGVALRSVSSG